MLILPLLLSFSVVDFLSSDFDVSSSLITSEHPFFPLSTKTHFKESFEAIAFSQTSLDGDVIWRHISFTIHLFFPSKKTHFFLESFKVVAISQLPLDGEETWSHISFTIHFFSLSVLASLYIHFVFFFEVWIFSHTSLDGDCSISHNSLILHSFSKTHIDASGFSVVASSHSSESRDGLHKFLITHFS